MSGRPLQVALALVLIFAAAQLIRPQRANPPIDPSRAIQSDAAASSALVAIVDRACRDCHTNATVWPAYTRVAPLSWLMAYGVAKGREVLNFSEWASYPPDRQRTLLAEACRVVSEGKMPGSLWTTLHPEARLSARDVETICAAAHSPTLH